MKNTLRQQRVSIGLSQTSLGCKIGLSRQSIGSLEKGKHIPSVIVALKLAKVLKEPVSSLFVLEPPDYVAKLK